MKPPRPGDRSTRKAGRVPVDRADVGANRFRWTAELVKLLGKVPDRVVAKKTGLHLRTVGEERRRRGIPPSWAWQPKVEWTPEKIAVLGTCSDGDAAQILGISRTTVAMKRKRLGIPPYHPPRPYLRRPDCIQWRPAHLALLGKVSDHEAARRLRISLTTVRLKRVELGIQPFQERPETFEWTPEQIAKLGTVRDTDLAEEMGVTISVVWKKRTQLGIPANVERRPVARTEQTARLLRRPDHQLKKETGLNLDTIKRLRRYLETPRPPAFGPAPAEDGGPVRALTAHDAGRSCCRWQPEELALLGTAPDAEIAARLGRTAEGVAQRRRLRGIPPWRRAPRR